MFVLSQSINYNPNLSTNLKNFLRCLSDHCGDKAVCWPSQSRISQYMNVSIRTVQRMEREALELQFIEVERRWLRSNKYKMLCLEERGLSTMPTQERHIEQNTSLEKKRSNGSERKPIPWKSPADIKVLIEDMEEVFGPKITERNRGWFYRIAQAVEDSWIYESLSWLKQVIFEAECSGTEIKCPSALFTWRLRQVGMQI